MDKSIANEREALRMAAASGDRGGWLPPRGFAAAAARLERRGLLAMVGVSGMPPYALYKATEAGLATSAL